MTTHVQYGGILLVPLLYFSAGGGIVVFCLFFKMHMVYLLHYICLKQLWHFHHCQSQITESSKLPVELRVHNQLANMRTLSLMPSWLVDHLWCCSAGNCCTDLSSYLVTFHEVPCHSLLNAWHTWAVTSSARLGEGSKNQKISLFRPLKGCFTPFSDSTYNISSCWVWHWHFTGEPPFAFLRAETVRSSQTQEHWQK